MKTLKLSLALICLTLWQAVSFAQVPGDGIPDIYYFVDGSTAQTSIGEVALPAGWLTVDTDGTDMVTILIGGDRMWQPWDRRMEQFRAAISATTGSFLTPPLLLRFSLRAGPRDSSMDRTNGFAPIHWTHRASKA